MSQGGLKHGEQGIVSREGLDVGTVVGEVSKVGFFWVAITSRLMVQIEVEANAFGGIRSIQNIREFTKNITPGERVRIYGSISEFVDFAAPGIISQLNTLISRIHRS